MIDSGQTLPSPVTALHPVRRGAKAPKHVDADDWAAARASIKLELGDVSSSSSSIFNVNIITPTSRGDILRQIVSSVYIA